MWNRSTNLVGTVADNIYIHLRGIHGLEFIMNSIQLPLESILGARIHHFSFNSGCVEGHEVAVNVTVVQDTDIVHQIIEHVYEIVK